MVLNDQVTTSAYGKRRDPSGKTKETVWHDGIDLKSRGGDSSVMSAGSGVVVFDFDGYDDKRRWEREHSGGNYVIIDTEVDGKRYFIKYLHLKKNYVTKGQEVTRGQLIGEYGDVGYSFGAHLHVTVMDRQWRAIDPTGIVEA